MGIRNNLLGVGSAGITTETGIIIGAAVVKIVLLILHHIAAKFNPPRLCCFCGFMIGPVLLSHWAPPRSEPASKKEHVLVYIVYPSARALRDTEREAY